MSFFRQHRRATAFLFALTLLTVSTKGLCLMPDAMVESGAGHACCKKSTETIAPACCMEGHGDGAAATMTVRAPAPLPGVATVSPLNATGPFVSSARQLAHYTDQHHSPPPRTILRV